MADHLVVCNGCGRAVPRARWQDHRAQCFALAAQLALSEDLESAATDAELLDDVNAGRASTSRRRLAVAIHPKYRGVLSVHCEACLAKAGEDCVQAWPPLIDWGGQRPDVGAPLMRPHQVRRDLARELGFFATVHGREQSA